MNESAPRSVNRVYFFKKGNGEIIAIDGDREAWNMYAHPTRVFINEIPPVLIGTSNGQHYFSIMNQAKQIAKEQGFEKAQEIVRKAYLDEIEIAKKTIIPPPNYDTVDKYGMPTR